KGSAEIALLLDMPLRVVQRVRQVWNEIGEVPRQRRLWMYVLFPNPVTALQIIYMMLGMLEHSPDLYLDEIQEKLSAVHGVEVCLKRLGMTSKKLSKPAAKRCEEARRAFAFEVGKYPVNYLVTAHESAVNLLTTYRRMAGRTRAHGLAKPVTLCVIQGTSISDTPLHYPTKPPDIHSFLRLRWMV
ncbi:hypothetical protein DFH08DRAFT_690544, partial [Mycena albidolilacea]